MSEDVDDRGRDTRDDVKSDKNHALKEIILQSQRELCRYKKLTEVDKWQDFCPNLI